MRRVHLALALTVVVATAGWALHDPGDGAPELPNPGYELSGHARLFYDLGDLDGLLEYLGRWDTDRSAYAQGVRLGAYYRVHDNVKLGAFYRLGFGERHDEDWIESGSDWIWRDTARRPEHTFILDATPRFLFDFLPGEDWVFQTKVRYALTYFEQDGPVTMNTLLVRPGLTWFWIRDREPVLNASLQYAAYLPLDFGENWWYRHGPYVNLVYHLGPQLMVNASVGRQWIFWTESADFLRVWPDDGYTRNVYSPWTVDAGVILRLAPGRRAAR